MTRKAKISGGGDAEQHTENTNPFPYPQGFTARWISLLGTTAQRLNRLIEI